MGAGDDGVRSANGDREGELVRRRRPRRPSCLAAAALLLLACGEGADSEPPVADGSAVTVAEPPARPPARAPEAAPPELLKPRGSPAKTRGSGPESPDEGDYTTRVPDPDELDLQDPDAGERGR